MSADVRNAVLAVLARIAPEADLDALPDDVDVREELDIDSIDFLSFMVGIYEALGVDVPEADYPQCVTIAGCVAYLAPRI
ncbi:MAG: acyl carrier protein [Acidimicrobiia bacterium]